MSRIVSATVKGDAGVFSAAVKSATMRWRCVVYGPGGAIGRGVVVMGVAIMPGSTIATRIPNGFSSAAKTSLRPSKAHFDAAYGPCGADPRRPATEVTLMMHRFASRRIPVQRL